MIISQTLSSAIGVGLDSDLANHDDLDDLLRGAHRAAVYLWNHLDTAALVQVRNDLKQFLVDWDDPTIREIERAMNAAFDDDEQKTHLRPTIERIVTDLDRHLAQSGSSPSQSRK